MGSFDVSCNLSGTAITYGDNIVAILVDRYHLPEDPKIQNGSYMLAAPPIFGYYSDYGSIEYEDYDLLGKSVLDWWNEEGYNIKSEGSIRQYWHVNADEQLDGIVDDKQHEGLIVLFIAREVWDLALKHPNNSTWTAATSLAEIDNSYIDNYVDETLYELQRYKDLLQKISESDYLEREDDKDRLCEMIQEQKYMIIKNTYSLSYHDDLDIVTFQMSVIGQSLNGIWDAFVSGSSFIERAKAIVNSINLNDPIPDREQTIDFVKLCLHLRYLESMMSMNGLHLNLKPPPRQCGNENWELQIKYHKDVAKILKKKLKAYKKSLK